MYDLCRHIVRCRIQDIVTRFLVMDSFKLCLEKVSPTLLLSTVRVSCRVYGLYSKEIGVPLSSCCVCYLDQGMFFCVCVCRVSQNWDLSSLWSQSTITTIKSTAGFILLVVVGGSDHHNGAPKRVVGSSPGMPRDSRHQGLGFGAFQGAAVQVTSGAVIFVTVPPPALHPDEKRSENEVNECMSVLFKISIKRIFSF